MCLSFLDSLFISGRGHISIIGPMCRPCNNFWTKCVTVITILGKFGIQHIHSLKGFLHCGAVFIRGLAHDGMFYSSLHYGLWRAVIYLADWKLPIPPN